jgi:polyisoprenoid-binding protein YceI
MTTAVPATQVTTTATTWTLDPAHTLVEFSAKHMMFTTVKGRFSGVSGTIVEVANDSARSSVDVEIDAGSITTGDIQRDAHLKSGDFLDVENYPKVTFKSRRVEGMRERFRILGDLTIRGVTREVELEAEYHGTATNPWGKTVVGFTASTEINRQDFGLTWNVALEAGGVLVSDRVKITLEVQAVKQD